jgi:hypothetical protein
MHLFLKTHVVYLVAIVDFVLGAGKPALGLL